MTITKYKTILIDPPWNETGGGKIKRGADKHYKLLKTPDILEVIKTSGVFNPDDDCHLYLWVTNNFLKDGLWLIEQLGFRYITMVTWVKDRFGLGYYFRGQTEHILFSTRGHVFPLHKGNPNIKTPTTILNAKRTKHSKKPMEQYEIIESVSTGPRLEMFARHTMSGWDSWGNEIDEQTVKQNKLDMGF